MKSQRKKYNIKTEFLRLWQRNLDDCFIFWKCFGGNINNLHKLLQNLHPKIKFTIEHNFKELPILDILIKIKRVKLSQIYTTNLQSPNNTSILRVITPKTARKICTIVICKKSLTDPPRRITRNSPQGISCNTNK